MIEKEKGGVINMITIKQQLFVDEYLIDLNATQAAIRAGYSSKTAGAQAGRLLQNVKVEQAIEEAMKKKKDDLIMKQDEVLRLLSAQARRLEEHEEVVLAGEERTPTIIKTRTQNKDALKALELLGKRYGLFTDKVELTASLNEQVEEINNYVKARQFQGKDDGAGV